MKLINSIVFLRPIANDVPYNADISTILCGVIYQPIKNSCGVEIRDLDNRRTNEIVVTVSDEEGTVFSGFYNQYNQRRSDSELPVGVYTITLVTPEGTLAEINETVASQVAVATDEDNVFAIEVNLDNRGSLSAVFAAF